MQMSVVVTLAKWEHSYVCESDYPRNSVTLDCFVRYLVCQWIVLEISVFIVIFILFNTEEYKVTLAIFSGRPDPVWTIDSRHESFTRIKELLSKARANGFTYRDKHMPARLGYKGFLLHHSQKKHAELIMGAETALLQQLLLDTMPEELITSALRQNIAQAISPSSVSPVVSQ